MSVEPTTCLGGFGSVFQSEALPGALPREQRSPQHVPYGLYAEQFSSSAFTRPRHLNRFTWLYRLRPSVCHSGFQLLQGPSVDALSHTPSQATPMPHRWFPLTIPKKPTTFWEGLHRWLINGDPASQHGGSIYLYAANATMEDTVLSSADGEWLLLPQEGTLICHTELGTLTVPPGHLALIPRGMKFQIAVNDHENIRGYVLENYGEPLELPTLGLIGANGLADARHFIAPTAAYQDEERAIHWVHGYQGQWWLSELSHHPLDVVAWSGNAVPLVYDMRLFCPMNTVSWDHADPSIFTLLTSPSGLPGVSNFDVVLFPPRWSVAENTFRPPYFHRNIMSEYMGLIQGAYDAKADSFVPGGSSLHNMMTPHGPDSETTSKAITETLSPVHMGDTLAFMLESRYPYRLTPAAMDATYQDKDYVRCWASLPKSFKLNRNG